jgi:hypothetical protein
MEVGKAAKHMGIRHPRDLRREMLIDERALAKTPIIKTPKNYGFSYEQRWFRGDWVLREEWFTTKRGRDQALAILRRRHKGREDIRSIALVTRGGAKASQ